MLRPKASSPELVAHARRLVADWPPLTQEQRTRLATLVRPAAPSDQTEARAA